MKTMGAAASEQHIVNRRLFNFAVGSIVLADWERQHLHECEFCQEMAVSCSRTNPIEPLFKLTTRVLDMKSDHIDSRKLYEVVAEAAKLEKHELEHLSGCAECLEMIRIFVRQKLTENAG